MSAPAVVAIFASCGTRDNFNSRFNPGYKRFYSCDLATNQSSLIALMSPPFESEWRPLGEMNDYDRWNVASDMSREFLPFVANRKPTYLVLDFFGDIHFGVLRLTDGRYLTANRWKLFRTDVYERLNEENSFTRLNIFEDTEEYLALWRDAMDRFAAHVAQYCPDTCVIVHRGYNTGLVRIPDRAKPIPMHKSKPAPAPLDVARANELWEMLDDYCINTFGWESIDLRDEGFMSYAEHPWGAFYVHYEVGYYHRFLAELHKIHLRRSGVDDDLWARLLEIEEAAREQGDTQVAVRDRIIENKNTRLARQRARIAEQRSNITQQRAKINRQRGKIGRLRGRINELESLSLLSAARFAVGQRMRSGRAARRAKDGEL